MLITGSAKAALGLALLGLLPELGFTSLEARSAVFIYEAMAQLAFVYPARRAHGRTLPNRVLNVVVIVSIALQLSTAFIPALRALLGLEVVTSALWAWIVAAVITSWGFAEIYGRFSWRPSSARS